MNISLSTHHSNKPSGLAEIFGVELVPGKTYAFCDAKLACFTWYGAAVETSEAEGVRAFRYFCLMCMSSVIWSVPSHTDFSVADCALA